MISKVDLPEASKGDWRVMKFEVDKRGAMMHAFSAGARACPEGVYTKLIHAQRGTIMSDTPAEMRDHYEPVRKAKGRCLINGLGLGMVLQAFLNKPEVTEVIVIEMEQDVIDLVAHKYIGDPRVKIIRADAYEYKPEKGVRFDVVWHDIWDTISEENLSEMGKLHRKYGRLTDWQGSWAKEECLRLRRQDRYSSRKWGWL